MLLSVENLSVTFPARGDAPPVEAVKDVSLAVNTGEILALVGESGSGKSLTALSVMRLLPSSAQVSGKILFYHSPLEGESQRSSEAKTDAVGGEKAANTGVNLLTLPEAKLRAIRGNDISMIFQEPLTALNPLHTIGKQISEVLRLHPDRLSHWERPKAAQPISGEGFEYL